MSIAAHAGSMPVPDHRPRRHHRVRTTAIVLGIIVVALVVVRLMLPTIIRDQINKRLAVIPDYTGHVNEVGVSVFRGAYTLYGLEIERKSGKLREPFFSSKEIDFSLAWRELIHGKVVSDIYLTKPALTFVKGPTEAESQTTTDKRWQDVINDIFPVDITFFHCDDGTLRYINTTRKPTVDVQVEHAEITATGLRNRPSDDKNAGEFPAHLTVSGVTIGKGNLKIVADAEPLALKPHFLLKFTVENVDLVALNQFLRAYMGIDVSAGNFKGYMELTARNGHFEGYFKPFFEHLDFSDTKDQPQSVGKDIREFFARIVAYVFKNTPRDNVATRIPLSGDFDKIDYSFWQTFLEMFHHGFIQALPEKLDSQTKPGADGAHTGKEAAKKPPPVPEKK